MYAAWEVGVWKALAPHIRPDLIVGASAGAWNGWAIAGGAAPEELERIVGQLLEKEPARRIPTAEVVARRLVRQAPGAGYLLGDGNYDASPLFDDAAEAGYQLVVPMPDPHTGKGHRYQSPHRLRCFDLVRDDFGRDLQRLRAQIERTFGNAVSFGGGLASLPAWVRGRERVRTWVWAKLLINAVRILEKQRLTTTFAQCCCASGLCGAPSPPRGTS